ncbi:MAG: hypothetical protein A3I76_00120 [Elusimicrobia bacterium RIFCSPLOWO2_02_FULL_61_11]|nr:MAG: hypothetical protein A3I76_00120 [Elusimicrobia bacterium RIFCSPLOWO2_02_FULL_61_11]
MIGTLSDILKSLGYGLLAMALCWLARLLYAYNPARGKLDWQLLSAKSPAAAVAAGGYFLAVILSLGGPISWVSGSFTQGALDALGFGLFALLLLNASMWAADKTYFKGLELERRIGEGSLGAGLVSGAHEAALGLVILGASWGESGGVLMMSVFWLLGQLLLAASILIYLKAAKLDLKAEFDKDNTAAAFSAAGIIAGLGLIAWEALSGSFLGWGSSIAESVLYYAAGAAGIAVFRAAADLVLLPGATFRAEVLKGNLAVGVLDASLTAGIAMLLTWCLF